MIRTIIFFVYAGIVLILSLPALIINNLFFRNVPRYPLAQWIATYLVGFAEKIAGFKVEIIGAENIPDGPALFVGNHQSIFDAVIALRHLGRIKPFISKKENASIPIMGTWMRSFGCIFMDRGNLRQSLKCLQEAQDILEKGEQLVIFPEGTRSKDGQVHEFKAGSFKCAVKAGVPVIPFAIDGSRFAWEEKKRICPTICRLTVLPPIDTGLPENQKTKELAEKCRALISEALSKK